MLYRIVVFVIATTMLCDAQNVDTLRPGSVAVPLRQIAYIYSTLARTYDHAKGSIGPIGDLYGTGASALAVQRIDRWEILAWDPSGDSARVMQEVLDPWQGYAFPIYGNFRGDGSLLAGLAYMPAITSGTVLRLYEVNQQGLDTASWIELNSSTHKPGEETRYEDAIPHDLDGDGIDDLVVLVSSKMEPGWRRDRLALWIYKGGSGFQLDSPTVVIEDDEDYVPTAGSRSLRMVIGHFDADPYVDLALASVYPGNPYKAKCFFGNPGSPWNWERPGRVLNASQAAGVPFMDVDGDGILDIMRFDSNRIMVFRSGSGKSIRTRSYLYSDVDQWYYVGGFYPSIYRLGFAADSGRRYELVGVTDSSYRQLIRLRALPTTDTGMIGQWTCEGPAYPYVRSIPDFDGDGWDDILSVDPNDDDLFGTSVAHAGGPYIPHRPDAAITWLADDVQQNAIALWPNPTRDVLHVAWRGDLVRLPRTIEVYDMKGRLIERQQRPSYTGEISWACDAVAPGAYLVRVLDYRGKQVAVGRVVVCGE